MLSRNERNRFDLKEMENIKNAKVVLIACHRNVLAEMFTITEKSAFYTKKPAPTQVAIIICC